MNKCVLIICLAVMFSCQKKQEETPFKITATLPFEEGTSKKIRYSGTTEYICLDTREEALFKNMGKVIIRNNRIYIMDASFRDKNKVLCFNMNGNHMKNYGKTGKGPGEFPRATDFDVNEQGHVFIYSFNMQKVFKYDASGRFITDYEQDFYAKGFRLLSNGNFFFVVDNYTPENNSMICIFNPKDQTKRFLFEYNKQDKTNRSINSYTQPIKNGFVCYIPIRDYFFVFNNMGKLKDTYKIDFGTESLPEQYKYDMEKRIKFREDYRYIAASPIILDGQIIGRISNEIQNEKSSSIFMYDIKNQTLMKDPVDTDHYSHQSLYPYYGIHKGRIISMINISTLNASVDKEEIPEYVKEHVEKGGYALTLNEL